MCDTVGRKKICFSFEKKKFYIIRRGSPMVIGVKCADQLAANHIPVMFSKGNY